MHRRVALLSGILGATASCIAKFSLSAESPLRHVSAVCMEHFPSLGYVCIISEWAPRLLCLGGMIVLNTLMLGTFLEGMEESGSVAGTGLATASNFATSALLGVMLWQEKVDQIWIIGFTLVVSGVLILSRVQSISEESAEQEKKRL